MTRTLAFVLGTLLLTLGACINPYPAPVVEISDTPRFLDSGRTHRVNRGETLYAIAWMYDLDFAALARVNDLREPYTLAPGQILSVDLRGQPQTALATATTPSAPTTSGATVNPVAIATPVDRTPLPSAPLTRQTLPDSQPLPSQPAATTGAPTTADAPPAPPPPSTPAPSVATTTPPPVSTPPVPPVVAPVPVTPPAPAPVPQTAAGDGQIRWDWPARGNLIGRFTDSASAENKGIDIDGQRGDAVLAAADGEVVYAGSGLLRYGDLVILKHSERFLSAYAHNSRILVEEGQRVTRGQQIAELGSSGIDRNMLHFEIRLDGKPVDPLGYLPSR